MQRPKKNLAIGSIRKPALFKQAAEEKRNYKLPKTDNFFSVLSGIIGVIHDKPRQKDISREKCLRAPFRKDDWCRSCHV
jgi:hypothetical protein